MVNVWTKLTKICSQMIRFFKNISIKCFFGNQWDELACTLGAQFFVFSFGGELKGFGFYVVPNGFLNMFPIGPQFVRPICFALSSSLISYVTSPKEEATIYLFWEFSVMGQSKMPITKQVVWGSHNSLIHMNQWTH